MDDTDTPNPLLEAQTRAERLASDNTRLRSGVAAVLARAQDLPHVVMPNGDPLSNFCRALLTGPTQT